MLERRSPLVLIHLLASLLLMALTSLIPTTPNTHHHHKRKKKHQSPPPPPPPTKTPATSSWVQFMSMLTCRSTAPSQVHDPSTTTSRYTKLSSTCTSSICALRDVVHGNTRVVHRPDNDHTSTSSPADSGHFSHETAPLARSGRSVRSSVYPSSFSSCSYSRGPGMQLRKLSGCYECHAISDPSMYPRPRTLCACTECGEVFTKPDSLEHHRALRHAVSELGPEDSGRNIVEIIFKSSWQKKDNPICKIERILKVRNTQRTISRFEDYRDSVKSKALLLHHLLPTASAKHHPKKNPRCAADGNELLRFHCTTLSCSLGARGSTALCCSSSPTCGVCSVIRHGFGRAHHDNPHGVRTTASSGRAHDCGPQSDGGGRRAMLVCRVIAGRIRRAGEDAAAVMEEDGGSGGAYDSVAGQSYGNLEELFVSNPRAILPCFVVIYRTLD